MLNFAWLPEAALLKMFTEYIRSYLETHKHPNASYVMRRLPKRLKLWHLHISAMGSAATLGAPAVLVAFMGPRI